MSTPQNYAASKDRLVYGAAYEWTEQELGGPVTINANLVNVLNAGSFLVQGNPDRVAISIVNLTNTNIVVAFQNQGTTGTGIILVGQGSFFGLTLRDDFTLASIPMWLQASGGATAYVVEYIRLKP